MRIKKNCFGCRALNLNTCKLNYKIITYDIGYITGAGLKPLEICPKPKTYNEFINLYNNQ